jgi:hypothetical protein
MFAGDSLNIPDYDISTTKCEVIYVIMIITNNFMALVRERPPLVGEASANF